MPDASRTRKRRSVTRGNGQGGAGQWAVNGADGRVESGSGGRCRRGLNRGVAGRARQTHKTRPMDDGWKRNDAMRCDATRTPHGAMRCDEGDDEFRTRRGSPQCCSSVCSSSLSGQATSPRCCSSATTDSASFRASSGRPSTWGGAERQGPGTDGKLGAATCGETKEGFQFDRLDRLWGHTGGVERRNRCEAGVMDAQPAIPMIGELPPDCIIRCLKWLVPLPPPLLPRPQGDHNTAAIRQWPSTGPGFRQQTRPAQAVTLDVDVDTHNQPGTSDAAPRAPL